MRRSYLWSAAAAALGVGVAVTATLARPRARTAAPAHAVMSDAQVRDLDIAFYQARVARDPAGALDRAQLAGLYLQRTRETGDNEDLVRAEAAARASFHNRQSRNSRALAVLTNSLLAQHQYPQALETARELAQAEPEARSVRALLGELEMELGRYDEARVTFQSLTSWSRDMSVVTRLARWEELQGHNEAAHQLLVAGRDRALKLYGLPAEERAWFHLRVADIALRNGRLSEAEHELDAGLAAQPEDYRVLGMLARLEAARHEWRRAIDYGERAIARALDPATLGVIGDAYAALGDSAKAEEYYRVLEVSILRQPGPFHRAWSLFLLDHDRRVPEVLEKVQEEIGVRRDIYGYDLLAWALHKAGRETEAARAIDHALALGTRDAMLFYHAGMIAQAEGRRTDAVRYLREALAINPFWHPTQPAEARAVLEAS